MLDGYPDDPVERDRRCGTGLIVQTRLSQCTRNLWQAACIAAKTFDLFLGIGFGLPISGTRRSPTNAQSISAMGWATSTTVPSSRTATASSTCWSTCLYKQPTLNSTAAPSAAATGDVGQVDDDFTGGNESPATFSSTTAPGTSATVIFRA